MYRKIGGARWKPWNKSEDRFLLIFAIFTTFFCYADICLFIFKKIAERRMHISNISEPEQGILLEFQYPDGSRKTRRFLESQPIQVFDVELFMVNNELYIWFI